jgi:hypothetical protein
MKTTSLELSKQLKEAGFPQESFMFYCQADDAGNSDPAYIDLYPNDYGMIDGKDIVKMYAAPTAEEILDELPKEILFKGVSYRLRINALIGDAWSIEYRSFDGGEFCSKHDKTLSELAGRMWIDLKGEGLI